MQSITENLTTGGTNIIIVLKASEFTLCNLPHKSDQMISTLLLGYLKLLVNANVQENLLNIIVIGDDDFGNTTAFAQVNSSNLRLFERK